MEQRRAAPTNDRGTRNAPTRITEAQNEAMSRNYSKLLINQLRHVFISCSPSLPLSSRLSSFCHIPCLIFLHQPLLTRPLRLRLLICPPLFIIISSRSSFHPALQAPLSLSDFLLLFPPFICLHLPTLKVVSLRLVNTL